MTASARFLTDTRLLIGALAFSALISAIPAGTALAASTRVMSVSATNANGAYKAGTIIHVTVTFSGTETVTGTPRLALETGATDRFATYVSGSGSNTLTFDYTVQPGDTASDLNYKAINSLTLNGGTIRNGTTNATLTLPRPGLATSLGGSKAIVIDTAAPALTQVTAVPASGTDTTPNYTFRSNQAGTIQYGGDCSSTKTAAVNGNNTVTFNELAAGTHSNCTITVTDAAGNQSNVLAVNSFTITAPEPAPTPTPQPTPPPPTNPGLFNKGLVSLSFDDGLKGHSMAATGAGGILQDAGYKGTFYIIPGDMIGATLYNPAYYTGFMNKSEVMGLVQGGHEIGVHSRTHMTGLASPGVDLLAELDGARYDLLSTTTLPASTFAYPFGEYNDTVIAGLKKAGIVGARTVDFINAFGQPTYNAPQTDPYRLAAMQINNATPITAADAPLEWPVGTPRPEWGYVEKWVDDAAASNTWLILIFHDVQANCAGDPDCISPEKLQIITNYLQSKGSAISVVPVKDGLAQMGYPTPASDSVAPTVTLNGLASGGTVTIPAISASGAPISFTTAVSDNNDTGLGAFCVNPAALVESNPDSGVYFPKIVRSGDTFPVGTSTVNCTSADKHGNLGLSTYSFVVTQ